MSELKPCPFCGGDDIDVWSSGEEGGYDGYVRCHECCIFATCFSGSRKEAVNGAKEKWNKRANKGVM